MADNRKKIYILRRNEDHVGTDERASVVVVAQSAPRARELARNEAGDEKPAAWSRKDTAVIYLGFADPRRREGVVHVDFRAG